MPHRSNTRCRAAALSLLFVLLTPALGAEVARDDCDGDFQRVLQPGLTAEAAGVIDARAVWLDRRHIHWPGQPEASAERRYRLLHAAQGRIAAQAGQRAAGFDAALPLQTAAPAARPDAARWAWLGSGVTLALQAADTRRSAALHRGQLVIVQEDATGRVLQATAMQAAGALDDLYAAAEDAPALGAAPRAGSTHFALWAPTAQHVALCLHSRAAAPASALLPLQRDARTGIWRTHVPRDLSGQTYTYLVDVFVRGVGTVRNRVTDPYAVSLTADSRRSWIGRLDAPALQPARWLQTPRPTRVQRNTDMVVYELHVRDFSISDSTVPAAHRGKYLAFTHAASDGMQHLKAMAAAGLTDVHLLPVFDIASVPEQGCKTTDAQALARGAPDGPTQQAAVMALAAEDCFNWGYDPFHYTAPEGSYATDAADGAVRIVELRRMVQALHAAGLRVGMDVVYNHTSASGQKPQSVLDRIVPGYYQRLDAAGKVETSTCCDNTATEHRMMARLMIDSVVTWARDHRIDSFRFDLMGHQPRAVMARLQRTVDAAAGRPIQLIGEGWNFGEVKDGARFVQASQLSLADSGIGTFSDRGRDGARGGGCCDDAQQTQARQGWLNGQFFDANGFGAATRHDLLQSADLVRVGLAGTQRSYRMTTHDGSVKALAEIDYAGQPAGYASAPGEVVNYVENHDNQTLFDIHVLKLPRDTPTADRARVQVLGLALTAFSQGIAYFHAGSELLRSKSGDRNSYDSGDWFNRLDFTLQQHAWGSGLPPERDNAALWPVLKPLLADAAIKPTPADVAFTRDAFVDLLKLRNSSTLFRLQTAAEVQQRLTLLNTGPDQVPTVMAGHLDGRALAGAGFAEVVFLINADKASVTLTLPTLQGRPFVLHPVHRAPGAGDPRPVQQSRWDAVTGTVTVPARTALVYVAP